MLASISSPQSPVLISISCPLLNLLSSISPDLSSPVLVGGHPISYDAEPICPGVIHFPAKSALKPQHLSSICLTVSPRIDLRYLQIRTVPNRFTQLSPRSIHFGLPVCQGPSEKCTDPLPSFKMD